MKRQVTLLIVACLTTAGCQGSPSALVVRAIPDPGFKLRGSRSLGEARAMLALGNPGLALEGFRQALRADGDSAAAFSGIASCYAAMGRFDLARSNYETALSLDPHNPLLLLALAKTLDALGHSAQAADARADALNRTSAGPSSTIAVARPPARVPALAGRPSASVPPVSASSPAAAQTGSTVTVQLPPLYPQELVARISANGRISAARSERGGGRSTTAGSSPLPAGPSNVPRLERISPGEVALLTTKAPMWRAQLVSRTRTSTTVRWVPVRAARAGPNIRLLNAARSAGLAGRARDMLLDRGWRKIEIGDATAPTHETVVLYPANRAALGRSLAAQFNCGSRKAVDGDVLLVLLGRDRAGARLLAG